jgi:hypothetical protein
MTFDNSSKVGSAGVQQPKKKRKICSAQNQSANQPLDNIVKTNNNSVSGSDQTSHWVLGSQAPPQSWNTEGSHEYPPSLSGIMCCPSPYRATSNMTTSSSSIVVASREWWNAEGSREHHLPPSAMLYLPAPYGDPAPKLFNLFPLEPDLNKVKEQQASEQVSSLDRHFELEGLHGPRLDGQSLVAPEEQGENAGHESKVLAVSVYNSRRVGERFKELNQWVGTLKRALTLL